MRFFCIGLRCFAFKVAPNVENDRSTPQIGLAAFKTRTTNTNPAAKVQPHGLLQPGQRVH
jgi:hypothetical protein